MKDKLIYQRGGANALFNPWKDYLNKVTDLVKKDLLKRKLPGVNKITGFYEREEVRGVHRFYDASSPRMIFPIDIHFSCEIFGPIENKWIEVTCYDGFEDVALLAPKYLEQGKKYVLVTKVSINDNYTFSYPATTGDYSEWVRYPSVVFDEKGLSTPKYGLKRPNSDGLKLDYRDAKIYRNMLGFWSIFPQYKFHNSW